jgi:hypothetical protein
VLVAPSVSYSAMVTFHWRFPSEICSSWALTTCGCMPRSRTTGWTSGSIWAWTDDQAWKIRDQGNLLLNR